MFHHWKRLCLIRQKCIRKYHNSECHQISLATLLYKNAFIVEKIRLYDRLKLAKSLVSSLPSRSPLCYQLFDLFFIHTRTFFISVLLRWRSGSYMRLSDYIWSSIFSHVQSTWKLVVYDSGILAKGDMIVSVSHFTEANVIFFLIEAI